MFRTTWKVTLPLMLPAILAGGLLVFILAAEQFAVPAVLGTPAKIRVLTTSIFEAQSVYPPRDGLAAALSITLLVIALGGSWLHKRLIGMRAYTTVGGKGTPPRRIGLGRWRVRGARRMPPLSSLRRGAADRDDLPLLHPHPVDGGFPLGTVHARELHPRAVRLSGGAARHRQQPVHRQRRCDRHHRVLRLHRGAVAAHPPAGLAPPRRAHHDPDGVPRHRAGGRPAACLDHAAFRALRHHLDPVRRLHDALPAGRRARGVGDAQQIHPELEESSLASGASWFTTFRRITLPLLKPGIAAGWALLFVAFTRELSASILLYSPRLEVLSVVIYDMYGEGNFRLLSALTMLQIVIAVAVLALAKWLAGIDESAEAGALR